jgi:hypothetical protein
MGVGHSGDTWGCAKPGINRCGCWGGISERYCSVNGLQRYVREWWSGDEMLNCVKALAVLLCVILTPTIQLGLAQDQVSSLILQFRNAHDVVDKERILNRVSDHGYEAGQPLLQLAKTTGDNDTRWLAIRGLGMLKFEPAATFLIDSLRSDEHYVRANAARALAELRYSRAAPELIHLLEVEQDSGVIEQTSLALRLIGAKDAIPVLESRMSVVSMQTKCWLLDAIAQLGSRSDLPFIAKYLYYGTDPGGVPRSAAQAISTLTGEDFGERKGSGLFDPQLPVSKARKWWEAHARDDLR